jgi:AbiV family abortive infection protein
MVKRKLNSYKGRLTPQQIADGMNAALDNARRLVEDAKLLLIDGRFPTATSLAILAIEESGKLSVLRSLALAKDPAEVREAWKDYRSHTKKNVAWLLPKLVGEGARKLEDMRPLFDESSDHPYLLDQIKQLGFYTDCLGQAHWSEPSNVIGEDLAKSIVQIAEIMTRWRRITSTEIELWIRHIKPVWKKDLGWMKQALVNWHREMKGKGLAQDDDSDMEGFVREGIEL